MSPAEVRRLLLGRMLAARGAAGLWLASAAALALSWRTGEDGRPVQARPTIGEVDELERLPEAECVEPIEREDALRLLRSIAGGGRR